MEELSKLKSMQKFARNTQQKHIKNNQVLSMEAFLANTTETQPPIAF